MSAPTDAGTPEPCEKCGAAMDVVPPPGPGDGTEGELRLICPRCNHEVSAAR